MKPNRQDTMTRSLVINLALNKQVSDVSVFVRCTVLFVLIMAFVVKCYWIYEWQKQCIWYFSTICYFH